ncbi:uncharacterized protein [Argopecten irradians]|uniref:uncharacterized protein n=1 Tax=Argopecten irradians TaxID=31199 RepID=UPI00371C1C4C
MKLSMSTLCWTLTVVFLMTEIKRTVSQLERRNQHYCVKYSYSRNTVRIYDFQSMNGTIITRLEGKRHYDSHLKCRWYIGAGAFGRVKLTFNKVDLPPQKNRKDVCSDSDHLLIKNSLGRYDRYICPGFQHPEQFISIGRGTYLTFESQGNAILYHKGIQITYEMFKAGKEKCPPGWTCGPENDDGSCSCYHLMNGPNSRVNFKTAQHFCGFSNANLVKIESLRMHEFIKGLVQRFSVSTFWIGLNDIEKEGTYEWIDRSSLFFKNSVMTRNEFNSVTKNCIVQEVLTGSWTPVSCEEEHFYVCEIFSVFDTTVYHVPKRTITAEDVEDIYKSLIIGASVGGGTLLFLICCCYCCCCRKSKNENSQMTDQRSTIPEDQVVSQNFIPPPPPEPTAPPLSELHPMSMQNYPQDTHGLPSYEECMGLQQHQT